MLGSIEAGGTKFVCAVGNENLEIFERISIPTTDPESTISEVFKFFEGREITSLGVGAFGPICSNKNSDKYGYITNTPKEKWKNFNLIGTLSKLNAPITFTTDVNSSAIGEYNVGAGKGKASLVYYTVGTGVGGGYINNGKILQGYNYPEMGHMLIDRLSNDVKKSSCPFHENCLEGLASGSAIKSRTGLFAYEITDEDFWNTEAYYLAQCIYNTTLILAPEIIVLGGGVMKKEGLLEKIKKEFVKLINDYVTYPEIDTYIVTPELGDNAATIGCFVMAKNGIKL